MKGRPPNEVYTLRNRDYVKVRTPEDMEWEHGYITHIDHPRQQIFVDVNGTEYQFSFNEYNKYLKK